MLVVQPPSSTVSSEAAAVSGEAAASGGPPARWTAAHGRPVDPAVLHRVLSRAQDHGAAARAQGLVLFDLDSTLLDNKPRQARILREFGAEHGIPELTACTAAMFVDWSLRKPMQTCGLSSERIQAVEPEARRFWRERFFTSPYCEDDTANPGARDFVARVLSSGVQVVYCTGRHTPMREGTLRCFAREGFPLPDSQRVHLLMKPSFELHDDEWKIIARGHIQELGELLAAFDNEPIHINSYHEHFPSATCVHLLTDDSARGVHVLPGVISVRDFILP